MRELLFAAGALRIFSSLIDRRHWRFWLSDGMNRGEGQSVSDIAIPVFGVPEMIEENVNALMTARGQAIDTCLKTAQPIGRGLVLCGNQHMKSETDHKDIFPTEKALKDPLFLSGLRRQMLKFAAQQLSDVALAEDVVQEALVGALKNSSSFAGRAALKTWVFAILKFKIVDALRQRQRRSEVVSYDLDANSGDYFDKHSHWQDGRRPNNWGNPEAGLLAEDFWRIFDACLNHLPDQHGRVFMMREFLDMQTPEICREVGISVSNLNVLLYRARLKLRECLEHLTLAEHISLKLHTSMCKGCRNFNVQMNDLRKISRAFTQHTGEADDKPVTGDE
eukprot:gene18556-18840_t